MPRLDSRRSWWRLAASRRRATPHATPCSEPSPGGAKDARVGRCVDTPAASRHDRELGAASRPLGLVEAWAAKAPRRPGVQRARNGACQSGGAQSIGWKRHEP